MSRNRIMIVVGLLVAFSMMLASCGPTPTATPNVVATIPPTAVPTAVPPRHGGWLDQIVFTVVSSDSAITQIQAGAIDVFAYALSSAQLAAIQAAELKYAPVAGTYYDIMYNGATCTDPNTLNPFADRKIREATNMLYDRNYINQEIYAGGGLPKFFAIQTNGIDYADLADIARGLEAKYAFNETKAIADIAAEMNTIAGVTAGADGKWQFKGKPIVLEFLIRRDGDGTRKPMGDYVSSQLEKAGFTVTRDYKKSSEAGPIWQRTSVECQWNIYTAGWISTTIERDAKGDFQQMYLPDSVQGIQPFLSNVADPVFQQVGDDLANAKFTTVEQRKALMVQALTLSMQDSLQVFIIDTRSFAPYQTNVQVSANLAGGIETAQIAFYTARFVGQTGGTLKWGESDLFSEPWNPIAGSNWAWDQGAQAAMTSGGLMNDPYTGLAWPLRAEKADLLIGKGLPIFKSLDWVTLTTADTETIPVPADAWVDWDATTQKFIPAGDGKTAKIKSTIYYPANMFDTVTWHDGSKISMADFMMAMIEFFDRAKPESAIYDEQAVPYFDSFMSSFKGVKIVSTSPLVIDTYTDNYLPDAELDITTWWPNYGYGESPWQVIAVANLAEAAGESAYSADKSTAKTIEQTSFVGGPTLAILAKYLDQAIAAKTIPYAPTMGDYLTAAEATARYASLKTWYADRGHFELGTGPYFLYKAFLVEKSLILQNYSAFPDLSDRWANFAEPHIAVVDITGPAGTVKIGDPATFDVSVTFGGQPYASADLKMVKYLLYDATGALVKSDLATLVSEGNYQVVLSAADTAKLTAGSNKLEIAAVSNLVAIPTFNSVQFVTAP
jgi:peptide/nickel transport system substrate-binding protein